METASLPHSKVCVHPTVPKPHLWNYTTYIVLANYKVLRFFVLAFKTINSLSMGCFTTLVCLVWRTYRYILLSAEALLHCCMLKVSAPLFAIPYLVVLWGLSGSTRGGVSKYGYSYSSCYESLRYYLVIVLRYTSLSRILPVVVSPKLCIGMPLSCLHIL